MPHADDRTPGLANALFGPRLGRPVFVAARTSTPLPMSVTDPATTSFRPGESVCETCGSGLQPGSGAASAMAPEGARAVSARGELRSRAGGRGSASHRLFDFCFLEGHVLAGDRVIFFEGQLLGGRARVLLGDVEEAGPRRAQEFDLLGDGFGHGRVSAAMLAGTLFGHNR